VFTSVARRRFALAERSDLFIIFRSQAHASLASVSSLIHHSKQSESYCAGSVRRESFRKFGAHIGAPSRLAHFPKIFPFILAG
jgi:hypothetical protein